MQYRRKGSSAWDQEHLALVCAGGKGRMFYSTDMRLNAIGEIIGEYVRKPAQRCA